MVFTGFKSVVWSLLTVISLIHCIISSTAAKSGSAVSSVSGCELDNDAHICTGAQYRMYCNTTKHRFSFQRYQYQNRYQCMSNDCICVGNKDTCACYYNTSSCFCESFNKNITLPTAVSPVYDCGLYNDMYICTGAQYRMHCNTSIHDFHYSVYHYHCLNNNCSCIGNKDTCTCSSSTLSSCFCETISNSITIPTAVRPVYDCGLYNDTYICTGAQYRMYCNTRFHSFNYQRYRYPNQYRYKCWNNNCDCVGYKDTCTCSSSTLSSCFCETSGSITIPTAVSPVADPDCVLQNNTYICTGAQYRMYCNTQMHDFSYQKYQFQYQYQCVNNDCDCVANKDTCTCSSSSFSSCFCETFGNIIALTTAVRPVYDCVLYNDTSYICTGAQYHMYCNTSVHDFHYNKYHYHCLSANCDCIGNKDTCVCYNNMSSSCYCTNYNNSITIPTAVRPVYDCGIYNDTYICTGAQYHMYCNTKMNSFYYWRYEYQNEYLCISNDCICFGNKDTCTCYSSTLSSCFCETYGNTVALSRAVSPAYGCVLYNDTYICTGAQYRMYCNTRMHKFYYWRYQYQNEYLCISNDCFCVGHKDTCTCYSSTLSSCFCETYNNSITIPTSISPLRLPYCVIFNDTYICSGAQYSMHCNTRMHYFYYLYQNQNQYQYQCWNNDCDCVGNKDTCTCSSSTLSSCFCETNSNYISLTTAVTPAYGCVLYNDTSYICTGAQYHMYCNTSLHDFHYDTSHHHCLSANCGCIGYKDTCVCYYNMSSSCFCTNYNNTITIPAAVRPVYDIGLYNDTYICTGAQYRMHCNTSVHDFHYSVSHYHCLNNNCDCVGNKDTCTCSSSTLSSCFCEPHGNTVALSRAVSPANGCVFYNDTYICTGAQYRMYCNTRMHDFYYQRNRNLNQYLYECWNNNCDCVGDKDTCTCSSSTLSSCFCETYNNSITIPTAVSPLRASQCVFFNDTYICSGAQYRMYCNTSVHDFYYWRYRYQDYYLCLNNNCICSGNKDTCTCSRSTLSSCFCETNSNYIALTTAVTPSYDCGLYNDTSYICTGAQYHMYCNTSVQYFHYNKYHYHCFSNNCGCIGNKDTCVCYYNMSSSCFCTNYNNSITIPTAVRPVYDCVLYNDTYICTGAQYRMHCNTRLHYFDYQRYRNPNQYQYECWNNNCDCVGNKDTCTCSRSTLSSCFCEPYGNTVALSRAVSPANGCVFYNDTYICTGAQYRMYCNTRMHDFYYQRNRNLNQYLYECWNNNCYCVGDKDTCTCSSSTLSSCFCETYNNSITIPTAVSPLRASQCVIFNDTYICSGAQYRMHCNTSVHDFYYWRYRYQDYYLCFNNNCICFGNKDTCTCSRSTLSSCFCETNSNYIALTTAVTPAYGCVLYNDTSYICTGAQYHMYCNTSLHDFHYDTSHHHCLSANCGCIGYKDTCVCYYNMSSSCFCTNYNNTITIPTAVRPVYDIGLYNDTYICTGAQYRMHCNTSVHDFHYSVSHYHCLNNNCDCVGNKDTCTCSRSTFSSCFCEPYGNTVAHSRAVSPANGCVFYNDTYICTGAQYRMYCNTRMHDFYYQRNRNLNQYLYECWNNNCDCVGDKDTCTCYSSTLSSCFCETYNNSITIPTAVSPLRASQCVIFNDTYICSGAQYRMHCNTSVHDFYYWRYRYQDYYLCMNNNCICVANKDTCTCYYSSLSSCFCETNSNYIALTTAVSPVYDCGLYNDTSYICTGAQYHMYCNTSVHDFHYNKSHHHCLSNNCDCIGNKDTCVCYYNMSSSCFCTNYNNSITIPTAVRPVYDCVLYNDTYICTGAQYRMHCNTRLHGFNYQRYSNPNQYRYKCWNNNCDCVGNKDTCTCSSSSLSSCFCETYGNITALSRAVSPANGCVLYNDTYVCTGAQYRMYCNTRKHDFYYWRYQYQNQDQDEYLCIRNDCICVGDKDTCTCYSSTLSSCFCETYNNNITIPTAVSPLRLSQCEFFNDTYICSGAQYRMYCNTRMHYFNYRRYQNQNQYEYQCGNNCACIGNNDTCTCYSSTASSCFCENISTPITTGLINILPDQCNNSGGCFQNLLAQIENITAQELTLDTVTSILTMALNASEKISSSSVSPTELASYGNRMLKTSEKLISTLVKSTDTSANISFTLAAVEVQVLMVGANVNLDKIPRLDTTSSSVDIDLIGIAKNNNQRSAAVAFMSYNTMENLLKPDFFNTSNDTVKTMMSTVISATLPKTTNTKLSKPVNFTLKHIREFDPSGSLSCVYWNVSEWIVDGCSVLETNSSYTVCSCVHLSTFALVQTSSRPLESNRPLDQLTLVFVIVGLVFFSVALLIFALCWWSRMRDWIYGHSGVRLVPGGYVRELSSSNTGSASDVSNLTSKVSQEKHCNITLSLEHMNQNIYSNA